MRLIKHISWVERGNFKSVKLVDFFNIGRWWPLPHTQPSQIPPLGAWERVYGFKMLENIFFFLPQNQKRSTSNYIKKQKKSCKCLHLQRQLIEFIQHKSMNQLGNSALVLRLCVSKRREKPLCLSQQDGNAYLCPPPSHYFSLIYIGLKAL